MLSEAEKLRYCRGCHCNFYNGNNPMGIKECWCLKDAELVVKKEVHMTQVPPWKQAPIKVLNCYKADHYVYVEPGREY